MQLIQTQSNLSNLKALETVCRSYEGLIAGQAYSKTFGQMNQLLDNDEAFPNQIIVETDEEKLPFGKQERVELSFCNSSGTLSLSLRAVLERAYRKDGTWKLHFRLNSKELELFQSLATQARLE